MWSNRIAQGIIRLDNKQTTWSPIGDISVPMISRHQTPICQRPSPLGDRQPPVLSLLSVWFIFGYVSRSLSFPLFHSITHSPYTPVSYFHQCCVPHSFIHSLTHPLTSAYSFLSRTHMPLFFADSFVHMTHFNSDLLINRSHTPYPLCSFIGRCSPIWVNNRVDTSSHASLLHVFK